MKAFFYDRALEDDANTVRLYRKTNSRDPELVLKGFLSEIPSLNITNNWGGNGGSFLTSLIDSVAGAVRSPVGQGVTAMMEEAMEKNGIVGGFLNNTIGRENIERIRNIQNAHYTSLENLVKQYSGTQTSINITPIKIMYIYDKAGSEDPRVSVLKAIEPLVGRYIVGNSQGSDLEQIAAKMTSILGIQKAPNGYQLDFTKALEGDIDGTFILQIGKIYEFRNVICTSVDVAVSPNTVMEIKEPDLVFQESKKLDEKGWIKDTKIPLWAELTVSYDFAREFTWTDYENTFKKATA